MWGGGEGFWLCLCRRVRMFAIPGAIIISSFSFLISHCLNVSVYEYSRSHQSGEWPILTSTATAWQSNGPSWYFFHLVVESPGMTQARPLHNWRPSSRV